MPKVSEIEQELLDATGCKAKEGESRQKYLRRLHDDVKDMDDDEWEALSDGAQKWYNQAADARNDKEDLPDFAGVTAEEDDEVAKTTSKKESGDKPAAASKTDKPSKTSKPAAAADNGGDEAPAKKKAAAGKPEKSESKPSRSEAKGDGIKMRIKRLVIKNPKTTVEDLMTALEKNGDTMSRFTVSAVRSETRHTIKVLKDLGLLPEVSI
jgi:hypothetical protein